MEKNIIKNRKWYIVIPILLTIISVILLLKLKINSDLESYFPDDMESKINAQIIEDAFGRSEPLILVFETTDILQTETLERLKNLSKEFNRMKIFNEVISLFDIKNIAGEDGMMLVEPIVKRIPKNNETREALRQNIIENNLVYGTVVSKDFRHALFILNVADETTDEEVMQSVNEILEKYPGDEKHYINGMPFLRLESNQKISRDLMILLPIGLLLMVLFLFISFKEFRGVWLPLVVVVISTIVSMSLLPLMKWDLSLIGVLIPIMMIAIANNYGVHFIARYQELNAQQPQWSMEQITSKALFHLKKPIILTGLTTIVGIMGLVTHLMIPARQMGFISALGVGLALVLSLTFIPALLSRMKKGKKLREFTSAENGTIGKLLNQISTFIIHQPKTVIVIFSIALIFIGAGLFSLQIASDNNDVLPKKHSYNQSMKIMDNQFGGTKFMTVLFEGDCKEPEFLKRLDYYEQELVKMNEVGSVTSMAKVIKIMSKALNDKGNAQYNQIPEKREAIAQYLELYSMNGDPDDFESLINFDHTQTLMNIQFQASDMKTLNKVIDKVKQLTQNDPSKKVTSGYCLRDKEMAEAITKGQINSLIFAFLAILILLILIFRSINAGFIGILPLLFAVICTFGIMGFTGIKLNIVTALLSSISIGVGVDYTIHLFWRLKTEIRAGKNMEEAVQKTLITTGRGIVINAFSVIVGFAVLFLSVFPYLKMFATLIILSLFLCLICALILIPAICIVTKPAFLYKNTNSKYHE